MFEEFLAIKTIDYLVYVIFQAEFEIFEFLGVVFANCGGQAIITFLPN